MVGSGNRLFVPIGVELLIRRPCAHIAGGLESGIYPRPHVTVVPDGFNDLSTAGCHASEKEQGRRARKGRR
jgi:hypothetical protein